jgi:hypothetical protein
MTGAEGGSRTHTTFMPHECSPNCQGIPANAVALSMSTSTRDVREDEEPDDAKMTTFCRET